MQTERYPGPRSRVFSAWHRAKSIARFVGSRRAAALTMQDLDSVLFIEYDHRGKLPLALLEVAQNVGQEKPAAVMRKLAQMANIPAYVILYEPSSTPNPADPAWPDVAGFKIKRAWPYPEAGWRNLDPAEWAHALERIRDWQLRRFEVGQAANDETY